MLGGSAVVEAARVVVGVSQDPSCRDALYWAITNKIRGLDDVLVLLHVVTKIPASSIGDNQSGRSRGAELYQSEVNSTLFLQYVQKEVQPMMNAFKDIVDPRIRLEMKVGRNDSQEKGILEEAVKLRATCLVVGTSKKGMFNLKKASSTGTYCVRHRPRHVSVFVVEKEKVVLAKESKGTSPTSSTSSSPAGSGRYSLGSQSRSVSGVLESSYSDSPARGSES